jgi:hypothetical protein
MDTGTLPIAAIITLILIFHTQVIRTNIDACFGVHLFCVLLKFDVLY